MNTYIVLLAEYENGSLVSALVEESEFDDAAVKPEDFFVPNGLKSATIEGEAKIETDCSLNPTYLSD